MVVPVSVLVAVPPNVADVPLTDTPPLPLRAWLKLKLFAFVNWRTELFVTAPVKPPALFTASVPPETVMGLEKLLEPSTSNSPPVTVELLANRATIVQPERAAGDRGRAAVTD